MTMKKTLTFALVTGLAFGSTAAFAEGREHGHGNMLNKLDTNQDGKVTREELNADITTRFSAIDTNKDGKVTQEEASQYFTAKRDEMKQKFGERLKEADTNKDGKWSQEELSKMPERRFAKLDANSDGFVTQQELEARHAERVAKFQEKHGENFKAKLWERADANSDGVVDQAEALKIADARFSKLDANNDGAVERSEFKSGHRHGRGKHDCHGHKGAKTDKQVKPSTNRT
ncbi:MAG TPA: EF-hand domain-containing protein [Polyangiales bacterium]|nr:EF-hand domain-containing protein [Polyangiales bacterium]